MAGQRWEQASGTGAGCSSSVAKGSGSWGYGVTVHCMNLTIAFPDCFHSHKASLLQIPRTELLQQCCFSIPMQFIYTRDL